MVSAAVWVTLVLSPERTDKACGSCAVVKVSTPGIAARPAPELKLASSTRDTAVWLPLRPGVDAMVDCRLNSTSVAL